MFTNPYDAAIAQRDASQKRATQAGAVPWYRQGAVSGSLIGQDLGRSLGGMLGMQTPEQAKQNKIEEIMGQYGEGAKSYEQLLEIADSFRDANMLDLWEQTMGMAEKMKTTKTTSNPYLDAKRERNELALRLQQAYGNMDSLVDKKKFKQQLIEAGVGDSSVFTSIVGEINTLTTANLSQKKDTESRQEKLAIQMTKNGVPEIESALVEFEGLQAKYKNNLPGIGIDKWLLTKDAKDMRTAFAQVRNMVLKERSGAAVTDAEFKRLKEEIEGAMYTTDDDAIRWISRIRSTLERVKGTIFSGYGSAVKESYWSGKNKFIVRMKEAPVSGVIKWSDIK